MIVSLSMPILARASAITQPTLPTPTIPKWRPERSRWRLSPQVSTVRCRNWRRPSARRCLKVTRKCRPTTRTFSHQVRLKDSPSQVQNRALQLWSVPSVSPTRGMPVARAAGEMRSRSATMSGMLMSCQPPVKWLCMNANPAPCCMAVRMARVR